MKTKLLTLCLAATLASFLTMKAEEAAAKPTAELQHLTLGGGCFWCMEAVFERLDGVKKVTSGYAGGTMENPAYEQVCTGKTGHAEVVQIEFDPKKITLDRLLEIFWNAHDPTSLNRQGADHGTQYRSTILYTDESQRAAAEASKKKAAAHFPEPIVTEIVPLKKFYAAEDYHQHYFAKHPEQGYCKVVIKPKIEKLQQKGEIP
jgi:peptide-methionine (S)-S-oxide reductase